MLYASHMGWLHAMIEPIGKEERKARIDTLNEYDPRLKSPEVGNGLYLVLIFREMGMTQSSGMGQTPFTWSELKAFNDCSGHNLSGFELRLLRKMSVAYCSYLYKGEKPIPSPYQRILTDSEKIELGRVQMEAMERSIESAERIRKT